MFRWPDDADLARAPWLRGAADVMQERSDVLREAGIYRVIAFGPAAQSELRRGGSIDLLIVPRTAVRVGHSSLAAWQTLLSEMLGRGIGVALLQHLNDDQRNALGTGGIELYRS